MTALSSRNPLSQSMPQLKLPSGWSLQASTKTRTQLLEERRQAMLPHPSFDLDKDGIVGSQDLFLAKRFDKDGEGRLNSAERRAAEQALKEGVTKQFVWGVEQSAPHRSFRLLQKRGIVVDTEDFSEVRSTYPQTQASPGKTQTQLRHERAQARLAALKEQRQRWEEKHPFVLQVETREYPNVSPQYSTKTEKIDLEQKKARLQAGLSAVPTEPLPRPFVPQGYVSAPHFTTKTQLDRERKRRLLEDLHEQGNFDHKNADMRLGEREAREVTILPPDVKNRTATEIKEQLRRETNSYNVKTFSNVVVGIHGQDLPQFHTADLKYWELRPGYVPEPQVTSHKHLLADQRFWAPKDRYALADVEHTPPPPDSFKAVHVRAPVKEEQLSVKPTQCVPKPYVHWALDDPRRPPPVKHEYRWTTLVHLFRKGSVFAQLKDPDIENIDEIVDAKASSPSDTSELAGTMQSVSTTKKSTLGLGKKLMKQGATLVRSSAFQGSNG